MAEIIIVGKGPAGISAAIYAARAGAEVLVIGKDYGALGKAELIENYYGFVEPVGGTVLAETGVKQAERLGVTVITDEVVAVESEAAGGFIVKTPTEVYNSTVVILATGASHSAPPIEGLSRYEGRGVSWCAVCDAFFFRNKDVAVLGGGDYALSEAAQLLPVVKSVTLLTNGGERPENLPEGVELVTKEISALEGENVLDRVVFKDEAELFVSGVFVAVGVAGSTELARKLGAVTDGKTISTDEYARTNIDGLYAAGDCAEGLKQIAKAVHDGAKAGMEAVRFLKNNKPL